MGNVSINAFAPVAAGTVNMTASNTTGSVQVQATTAPSRHVRIVNTGVVVVFLEFGDSTVAAVATTGTPLQAGATEVFSCRHPYVAAITATGTAKIYCTVGEGI